jgi:heptosyltransferase-1
LSLTQVATLVGRARIAFGVDTGLAHLAAALGVPTVGIYCASDPAATGLYGAPRIANVGGPDGPPSATAVVDAGRLLCSEMQEVVW